MKKFFGNLKDVVWTAVFALLFALAAAVVGVAGGAIEAVLGLGFYAVVMAILTPRS